MNECFDLDQMRHEAEDQEIAEDLQLLELQIVKRRTGYKEYLHSPQKEIDRFLDQLDAERRNWR